MRLKRSHLCFFLLLTGILAVLPGSLFSQSASGKNPNWLQVVSHSFEGAISPSEYVLGPGDVLVYALWGQKNLTYTVPVTPQGMLIVPDVGAFRVSGKNLFQTKHLIWKWVLKIREPALVLPNNIFYKTLR